MMELIIMVGVVGWFSKTAKCKGLSGFLWGLIGALSYYVPVLVFGRLLYPMLLRGKVTYDNQAGYMLLGVLLSLVVGIGCCLIARRMLTSRSDAA